MAYAGNHEHDLRRGACVSVLTDAPIVLDLPPDVIFQRLPRHKRRSKMGLTSDVTRQGDT